MAEAAALVLCGGRSTRMGRPKALLPWCGRPMVEHVVETLHEAVDEIVVVTSEGLDLPPLRARVVRDEEPGLGPLAGLARGLSQTQAPLAYVTSTDAPFLSADFVRAVLRFGKAAAPRVDGHVQTLAAVYPTARGATEALRLLSEGRRRPLDLLEALDYRELRPDELPGLESLRGFNTPAEYLAAICDREPQATVTLEFVGHVRKAAGCESLRVPVGTLAAVLRHAPAPLALCDTDRVAQPFLVSLDGRDFVRDARIPIGPGERVVVLDSAAVADVHGFHGCYWRFDLSQARGERIAIPRDVLRSYLGGVGLGSWLLYREAPVGVDPLAPEAPLVFAFSPLVGTPLTTSAKFAVVAKSPLTGLLCDALSSSHFAIAGKRLGVDAIVLVGRCAEPSVLVGDELRPTADWGRSAQQASESLSGLGAVAAIGTAGENGVRFATISNEGRHAGRGGLGAVMGAKRLKAIVVRGDVPTSLADPAKVHALARDLARRSRGPATAKYRELGTVANLGAFDRVGALPSYNFAGGAVPGIERLAVEQLGKGAPGVRGSCAACTIGCEHRFSHGAVSARVEYESLFALGPLCGVSDPAVVLEAAQRCDHLGLDTLSAGGTIAFAMECRERGLLPEAPPFGDGAGMLHLLDDIAHRRALGELLADGSRIAARKIGGAAGSFAPHVKGLELPGYEPRALQTMALGLAVSTRGADHNKSGAYELDFSDQVNRLHGDERAARLATQPEDRAALIDSLVLCKFLRGVFDDLEAESASLLRAVTGLDYSGDELRAVARRVVDLRKVFNVREGWKPSDDVLPDQILCEPLPDGPLAGARLGRDRLAAMVQAYNRERGWSDDGYPSASTTGALLVDV